MRIAYGEGIVVAILLPIVLYLFHLVPVYYALFLVVLLFGLWTIVSSFLLVGREELKVYLIWGLILSCASSIFVISIAYALGLILIGVIASVFVFVTGKRSLP
jgi:hypothetical protein